MRQIKLKSDVERCIEYVHSEAVYQKYLTRLGELIIFVTRTAYPFPYIAKFMFLGVKNNNTQQMRR